MSPARGRLAALAAFVAALAVAAVALRRPAEEWWHMRRLRSEDEAVRRRAAEALGEMRSSRAIPHLFEAGRKWKHALFSDMELPGYVRASLERIVRPGDRETLAAALRHEDAAVRFWAGRALIELSPLDDWLFGTLSEDVAGPELEDDGWYTVQGLSLFGRRAVPVLEGLLEAKDRHVASASAYYLLDLGANARLAALAAMPPLYWFLPPGYLDALRSDELRWELEGGGEARRRALSILASSRCEGRETVRALLRVLVEGDEEERVYALNAIGNASPEEAGEALPELTAALSDASWAICRAAAVALIKLQGADAVEALPFFLDALGFLNYTAVKIGREESIEDALWAPYGLEELRAGGDAGRSWLTRELEDPDEEKRAWAACVLARIDSGNPRAARVLEECLLSVSPSDDFLPSLMAALRSGAHEALPEGKFREILDSMDREIEELKAKGDSEVPWGFYRLGRARLAIIFTLANARPAGARLLAESLESDAWSWLAAEERAFSILTAARLHPALAPHLGRGLEESRSPGLRCFLAAALGRIWPDPEPAVPHLLRALQDPYRSVRLEALRSLGRLEPRAPEALEALQRAAERPDLRQAAFEALGALGPAGLPALAGLLGHADPEVRTLSAWTLGLQRSAAAPAAPALIAALADPDLLTRIAAAEALGRLGPPATAALAALAELAAGSGLLSRHARLARERILGR